MFRRAGCDESVMSGKSPIYLFDNVRVEPEAFRVWKDGSVVQVEPKAFEVLLFLIQNRGRLVEKRELLDAVWKKTFVTENALTREIAQLRKALGEEARSARYIETVPTRGYRFIAEVRDEVEASATEREENTERLRPAAEETVDLTTDTTASDASTPPPPHAPSLTPPPPPVSAQQNKSETGRRRSRLASRGPLVLVVALGALVLVGTFIWIFTKKLTTTETTSVRRLTQVTTSVGLDFYPSLSPDASSLAYSSNQNGNFEIYVKQLALGGREIQITSDGAQNFQPAWSPDGQFLAYHSMNRVIWIVPAFGGVARRLTEFGSKPAWSPDGSTIVFQSAALVDLAGIASGAMPPSTIWTVPARGGQAKQLTKVGVPSGGHGAPMWSPDGQRIAFFTFDTDFGEVWSISARGDDLKQLAPATQPFYDLVYSPDGKYVYGAGTLRGGFGLWRVRVSPAGDPLGEPVKVEGTGSTPIRNLSVSADGKRIAYSTQSQTSDIWAVPIAPASGEAAGAPLALMEDTSQRKTNPAFSPDGSKIAFGVWRLGTPANIWLMDADGQNRTPLITHPTGSYLPGWLPGGEKLVFVSNREGHSALWSFDLKTGVEQQLFELEKDLNFSRLSPDGKRLAANSRRSSGTINVWTSGLEREREARQLTFDEEMAGFPCWSPDGKYIAFEIKRGDDTHIAIVASEGGQPVQLTFEPGQSWPHSWSPDGERIAFAGFRDGYWNVWWVSRDGRQQKRLTNYTKKNAYVRYPAWSPRGDRVVFEYAECRGNIWVMDLK